MKPAVMTLRAPARAGQTGVTLIVLLVMLVVITLLTMSSLRSTTMEEKMAGSFRDRDKAFQAAEAVVQACLVSLQANTFAGTKLTPVIAVGSTPAAANWDVAANWTNTNSTAVTISGANVSSDPRCMVELLGGGSYRVTGRAVGASPDSVVMLQATYSNE